VSERSPLAIGLVSPSWPPSAAPSGIVTYVANLEGPLRALGHRVSILTLNGGGAPGPSVHDVTHVHRERSLPRRLLDAVSSRLAPERTFRSVSRRTIAEAARRMVARGELDLLEMEESFGWAAAVQRAVPVPVCVRLHGPWFLTAGLAGAPEDAAFRARVAAEREALEAASAVSAPAPDVLERVRERYRLALPDAEVIPNPVAPVPAEARWRLDRCERDRVLFVGRFDRVKGADLVIEAFARVLERRPRARLTLVGPDGRIEDRDGRALGLEGFVRDRLPGALEAGRVEWRGALPFEALAPLRRSAMVTVVCSRYETFSYTAAEAMALGCPVVGADVGGVRGLVRDGESGLLHRPGDAADLATRLEAILADPDGAAVLGARAAEQCAEELDPARVAVRLVAFYERALGRWRPARAAGGGGVYSAG